MFEINSKKIKALKLAPWWKRLLAYMIDNIFLTLFLVIFISGIYGEEFMNIFKKIEDIGGSNFISQEGLSNPSITQSHFETFKTLSASDQNLLYAVYIIRSKYSQSIFILTQIISSLYFGLMWWGTGQTFGAKLLKIKVISQTGSRISPLSTTIRIVGLKFLELTWGLPALITVNPLFKQRIHDAVSQTVVVEEFSDIEEKFLEEQFLQSSLTKTPKEIHEEKDSEK